MQLALRGWGAATRPPQSRPFFTSQCAGWHVFIDAGANRGNNLRHVLEPSDPLRRRGVDTCDACLTSLGYRYGVRFRP